MKCPVCKTNVALDSPKCSTCGFSDIRFDFINMEEAEYWRIHVVAPYKMHWETGKTSAYEDYKGKAKTAKYSDELRIHAGDEWFSCLLIESGAVIVSYYGKDKFARKITIPKTADGHPVIGIGDGVFADETSLCGSKYGYLSEVILPDTVQFIGEKAFYNTGLKRICIPDQCSTIGAYAFSKTQIQEIVFPQSVKTIPHHVCSECYQLTSVKITGANVIENHSFFPCKRLKQITLPSTINRIEECAFSAGELRSIYLPPDLKTLNIQAWFSIKHIAFPGNETAVVGSPSSTKPVFYCDNLSKAKQYADKHGIVCKPLNLFPQN